MPFIDRAAWRRRLRRGAARTGLLLAGLGLAACAPPRPPAPAAPGEGPPPLRSVSPSPLPVPLRKARDWDEYLVQAGHRLVAANPQGTYTGEVPEPLLAIPVLEVELDGDGSVRRINVVRHPTQARDTVQLAMEAVRRAAPFGDVRHLPRPWRFTEVFLFDDDRRFKPRALDR